MPISLPAKIEITENKKDKRVGTVIVEPCYPGYGTTLGNALRRVLLSSLEGGAVSSVKISGVAHEFSTIPHVKEDVLEIILNLKRLRLKIFKDEQIKIALKAKGEKEVTGDDIEKNSDVEIVNPETKIATLTGRNAELNIEMTVSRGIGYVSVDQKEAEYKREGLDVEIGNILVDSVFSPIVNVGIKIENVRVGHMTNYEKLILDIETDGSITIKDAFEQSVKILIEQFTAVSGDQKEEERQGEIKENEEIKEEAVEKETKKGKKKEKNNLGKNI